MSGTDHDLLIKIDRDVRWLMKITDNHLKHHWALTLAAFGSTVTLIIGLVIIFLRFRLI